MNIDEALRILQLTEIADKNVIKKQYRRLMGRFHPDAVGEDSPERLKQAQLINEAYDFLKGWEKDGKSGVFTGKRDKTTGEGKKRRQSTGENEYSSRNGQNPQWKGVMNESAFCERNIYLYYHLEDEEAEHMYYQAAVGKYMWQPENEEFALFIMSIHHAVKELTEDVENRAERCRAEQRCKSAVSHSVNYSKLSNAEQKRFEVQAALFHLLTQQFVNPLAVLGQLSKPVKFDKDGRGIWHFRAWIGTKSRDKVFRQIVRLSQGELLYPKSFAGSKILVRNKEGQELGHLSFEEDWTYLCVIPLLKQRKAQVRMVTAGVEIRKGSRPYAVKADVDFYLHIEKGAEEFQSSADLNLKIADLLIQYEQYLLHAN